MGIEVFLEILLSKFIIISLYDIEPVVGDLVFRDRYFYFEELQDQLIHAVILVVRDVSKDAGFHYVDTGQRVGDDIRLLFNAGDSVAIKKDVAEGIGHNDFFDGER